MKKRVDNNLLAIVASKCLSCEKKKITISPEACICKHMRLNSLKNSLFIFIFLAINLIADNSMCYGTPETVILLSLPINIEKHERITEFKIKMEECFVVSIPKIPIGWSFKLDVHQSETNMLAYSTIGVADIMLDDISFFNKFIAIDCGYQGAQPKIKIEVKVEKSLEDVEKTLIFDNEKIQKSKL